MEHAFDVPAQTIGGRTMVPLRLVLESVGYYLDWDGGTQTVLISSTPIGAPATAVEGISPHGRQAAEELLSRYLTIFQMPYIGWRDADTGNLYANIDVFNDGPAVPLAESGASPLVFFGGTSIESELWGGEIVRGFYFDGTAFDRNGNIIADTPFIMDFAYGGIAVIHAVFFSLYDFDNDGIPEILIGFQRVFHGVTWGHAYTYYKFYRFVDGAYRMEGLVPIGRYHQFLRDSQGNILISTDVQNMTCYSELYRINLDALRHFGVRHVDWGNDEPLTSIYPMIDLRNEITQSIRQSLGLAD